VGHSVPGAGGVGLLDGDLIDPSLVDPVDDRVSQFTHQLKRTRNTVIDFSARGAESKSTYYSFHIGVV